MPPDQAEMIVQALQSKFLAQLVALVLPAAEEIEPVAIEGFPTGHEKGGQSPP